MYLYVKWNNYDKNYYKYFLLFSIVVFLFPNW